VPPNLKVSLTTNRASAAPGDAVDVRASVANVGAQTGTGVRLTIGLPTGAVLLGPPAYDRGAGCGGTTTLTCNLDFLGAGTSTDVRFSIRLPTSGPQVVTASVSSTEADSDPSDNRTSTTIAVNAPAAEPVAPTPTFGGQAAPATRKTGTARADTLRGTAGADVLRGLGGNDTLDGGAGDDLLIGGAGRDTLRGGAGGDRHEAVDGERDLVNCGSGRDRAEVDRNDVVRGCELVTRHGG
jgi:Ca2+-binding RTX toxin-like protein